jgi:hypothetical protein
MKVLIMLRVKGKIKFKIFKEYGLYECITLICSIIALGFEYDTPPIKTLAITAGI